MGRKLTSEKKKQNEENLLLFLQHIKEKTVESGGFKGNFAAEVKHFKVPSYNDVLSQLFKQKIVLNTGDRRNPCYKYVSEVEPNMRMAQAVLTGVRNDKKAANANRTDKSKTIGGEPAKPWQAGIDNGTITEAGKGFTPKQAKSAPIAPKEGGVCVSDDLFSIVKRIQVLTLLDDKVSSRTINAIINEELDKKPALKNSYRKFISKS